ncbi:cytochrome P450 monooxygenase [Penicillium macrosclerotiorum]|uniref:cytochrome P450 monooxygenase n=1 Tax=Penicillium macrosclerotiorum TaxID=303699 RepID=UPI002546F4A8|nr:cytochrome P450 monooxygenase [Penicillium macrosclerotiorum]KAJ5675692.1 cytochrome P450 monooxygenase [Penicillium macrosclerotiorum]
MPPGAKYYLPGVKEWVCLDMSPETFEAQFVEVSVGMPTISSISSVKLGWELFVADVSLAKQVLARKKEFTKPTEMTKKITIFGDSLASVEGADWNRHRRCTAVAFSDNINQIVWYESCKQAANTLTGFRSETQVSNTQDEMSRIGFVVLLKACMGLEGDTETAENEKHDLDINGGKQHLKLLLDMIPASPKFNLRFLQEPSNQFIYNLKGLGSFLNDLMNYRRNHPRSEPDLLSALLGFREANILTDQEIKGNIFLFLFAGQETTANTLLYILYLLAIFPEWQHWATEELDHIFMGLPPHEIPTLQEAFPRINRLKAIMYETLRLYGPVTTNFRKTSQTAHLPHKKELVIPENIQVNMLLPALHTNPNYWGQHSLSWNPDRWIRKCSNNTKEELDSNKINDLLAWAEGPRICPGKKFSQVEIIAVLVTLLRSASVHISPGPGENIQESRIKALHVVQQSKSLLTLHIPEPETVKLVWKSR